MSRDIEQLLAQPVPERSAALAVCPEDQWFDRKSPRVAPRELAATLVGMANADGGLVVIGIHDGQVEGIGDDRSRENAWRQAAVDFAVPPIRVGIQRVICERTADGGRDRLLVIRVPASDRVHATTEDEVHLRIGDETRRLTFDQRRELEFDKGQSTYEVEPARLMTEEHLDWASVASVAERAGQPDGQRFLTARGLLDRDRHPTIGAVLLFATHPQIECPEAMVRVLRYRGTGRGAGRRQRLVADVRVEGALPAQIDRGRDAVRGHLPKRMALGGGGTFTAVGAVPEDAWLEGLGNAVTHRSYSLAGDHIRVEIFDDRLEIESPGRFPGIVDLTAPEELTRFARNPRIARMLADLSFGQELGEGIRRMFEEMRLAGLAAPSFRQTAGSVRLTLSFDAVDQALEDRLPIASRDLLRVIRERERASTGDLVAATGRSRPTILRQLGALREEGLIEWVGTSRRDPRAYWRRKL